MRSFLLKRVLVLFVSLLISLAATPATSLSNQLKNHPSPYLALHGEDPVAWQRWDKSVVARARREKKLIYLSIGYFSCHWCHVMQRESYRNPKIAAYLNKYFIPVKIDRELEPALDNRMITFAEVTIGAAGWPLNVFITPNGYPLYAVLYLKPDKFLQELQKLQQLWRTNPEQLEKIAARSTGSATGPGRPKLMKKQARAYIDRVVAESLALADPLAGGFGNQSKFPSVPQLEFLLQYLDRHPNQRLRRFLLLTLDEMAINGLRDHLGGGFFRYTVDANWETPHFEKMLYDNALLARLYLHAGQLFNRQDYRAIAIETLDFMSSQMQRPSGGLIASFSAVDKQNVEGGYYLWDVPTLARILSAKERRVYKLATRMFDQPPFADGYLPMRGMSVAAISKETGYSAKRVHSLYASARKKLLATRSQRDLPVDTKLLAAWNGLALSVFSEAARVTTSKRYHQTAAAIRRYLLTRLWQGGVLSRAVANGRPIGSAGLEDYAYVARGLYDWARLTGNREDYAQSRQVVQAAWRRFYSSGGWRRSDSSLIHAEPGQDAILDGPMPAPSGVLIDVSLRLARHLRDRNLRRQALAALNSGHKQISKAPFWYVSHVAAMFHALITGYSGLEAD